MTHMTHLGHLHLFHSLEDLTSEAVKQSQRRPIHSAPVSALTGENVFRSKDTEAKVVPCFLYLLCHEIKTLFTAHARGVDCWASETFSIA